MPILPRSLSEFLCYAYKLKFILYFLLFYSQGLGALIYFESIFLQGDIQ